MLNRVAKSHGLMSEAADGDSTSFLVPSARFSGWLFILSCWGILLWLLNILQMATPTGDKVVWGSILTIGILEPNYLTDNTAFRPFSDGIFIIICLIGSFLSVRGIISNVEGGMKGWFMGVKDNFWPALVDVSTDGGLRKTISVWFMVLGLIFYIVTGFLYSGWVDPGVYSVAAPCIVFGWAFGKLADAQSEVSSDN